MIGLLILSFLLWFFLFTKPTSSPMTFGPADGPVLADQSTTHLTAQADIAKNPSEIPAPIARTSPSPVEIHLLAKEVIAPIAEGILYTYWTFNGTVPGPFLRVREGDTVELTLTNDATSQYHHNIDLHAVSGPGGGATVTNVAPGESKKLTFLAKNPGIYVYHCAHGNAAMHMTNGMYGLIFVEPQKPLPPVDKEFYVMQGELYTTGTIGEKGMQHFDGKKMLMGTPEYVVFNGQTMGAVNKMQVKTGERIRLYVGNGGVNMVSSFHIIGEVMDTVYPEGAIGENSARLQNVQTTIVPAGGATIVDFTIDVPGKYILVDHALARVDRGAWATIEASGTPQTTTFDGVDDHQHAGH
ncbi:nitrite reductase, copper-containing [Candidatus Gracilibacteria bacterium CG17_big_fil_post_rev_8_21_14_2_50_48_13]|nr:MAG: nitrite reductase, copper-containing [Candidatus Gracilibacteria bacterium CG17_big_fil_post_rev_8_21_14_2_50_48_13]